MMYPESEYEKKSRNSTREGLEATIDRPMTQARITQSGTRFFQFTSLKLQNGTFDTMVMPAKTAIAQTRPGSQTASSGSKPKSVSTQMRPAMTAAPEGLGRPWK